MGFFTKDDDKTVWDAITPRQTANEKTTAQMKKVDEQSQRVESILGSRPRTVKQGLFGGNRMPLYKTPEYIDQLIDLYGTAGADITSATSEAAAGMREQGEMALGVAETAAQRSEAPGMGLARENIGRSTADVLSSIREAGGGISSLGAINQAYQSELNALGNLAQQNAAYGMQAEQNLQGAYNQYGATLGQAGQMQAQGQLQGSQLTGAGLQTGAQFADQEYQLNVLDPYYDNLNFELAGLGYQQALGQQRMANQAQQNAALIQAGGDVVGGLF